MAKETKNKENKLVPEISIGLTGHVDCGKTTLTQALSGRWSDTHSEELKKGITIRLGYADSIFYKCHKCSEASCYSATKKCRHCKAECTPLRKVSFIDAPGHETLMATMLSGAAIIDAALLLVSANEPCPQPQTKEHLMALDISGVKDIIVVQNKVDLVSKEEALENYNQIKNFLKGTIAEDAPIIPISAQHNVNIDVLIKTIQEKFKTPERSKSKDPLFFIARSFDVNKPGSLIKNLVGGVLGGAVKCGVFKKGEIIEIKPGLKREKHGKNVWEPIQTEIAGFMWGGNIVDEIGSGGSASILTKFDPSIVKSDSLVGNVVGLPGHMPGILESLKLRPHLLDRVVGSKEELNVEEIKIDELLMFNVNSTATAGTVVDIKKDHVEVSLKRPVCVDKGDKATISRMVGARWRLIGYAVLK